MKGHYKFLNKLLFPALIIALPALLTGCITVAVGTDLINDIGADLIGLSQEELAEARKTPDNDATYTKRAALIVSAVGNPDIVADLQTRYEWALDLVVTGQSPNLILNFGVPTEEAIINTYVVYPKDLKNEKTYPVIFFSHGGGFNAQDYSSYAVMLSDLADETGCAVVFYEYRLAPVNKFPAAVHDTRDIYFWLFEEDVAESLHIDPGNMVLFGDSAGGNLVAGLTIYLAENDLPQPKGVVMVYPAVSLTNTVNFSRLAFSGIDGKYYVTTVEYLSDVTEQYLENPETDAYLPYASPLIMLEGLLDLGPHWNNPYAEYAADLEPPVLLAPHLIIVPEIDTLRDDGKEYAITLEGLGTEVEYKEYSGVFHGFLSAYKVMREGSQAFDQCVNFISEKTGQ